MRPRAVQVFDGEGSWPDGQDGLVEIKLMVCDQNEHEYAQCLAHQEDINVNTPGHEYFFPGEEMIVYRFDTDSVYRTVQLGISGSDICNFICYGLVLLDGAGP